MGNLHKLTIKGFRSIRDQTLEFRPLNVFIGANGAGKSNLIGVFHFIAAVVQQRLQTFTGEAGGANNLLYFGRKQSPEMSIGIEFREGDDANIYTFTLKPTDDDRFVFSDETQSYWKFNLGYDRPYNESFPPGHSEAKLSTSQTGIARYCIKYLNSYQVYHFHDTSREARVKQNCDVDDNRQLHVDARNLAAFLYSLKKVNPSYFVNIERVIGQIAPFFDKFVLEPSVNNPDKIRLEWSEKGSDMYFNAHTLSDGTLRFICLATLLLQPELPSLIIIDEPELGLHPAAIVILVGLLKAAATRTQLLIATQSVTLINQLEPDQLWVTERKEGASEFRRLSSTDIESWLKDYSLGELWEKNIIGGRP